MRYAHRMINTTLIRRLQPGFRWIRGVCAASDYLLQLCSRACWFCVAILNSSFSRFGSSFFFRQSYSGLVFIYFFSPKFTALATWSPKPLMKSSTLLTFFFLLIFCNDNGVGEEAAFLFLHPDKIRSFQTFTRTQSTCL